MILRALALLALLLPGLAAAQGYPALHDVTGVAADDVLNIRSAPDASSPIIGSFSPHSKFIEVVRAEGGWGRINIGERAGWVSLRYLARHPEPPPGSFPEELACYGTEPFWGLDYSAEGVVFSTPDQTRRLHLQSALVSPNHTRKLAILAGSEELFTTITITPARCNDGMSDREFGLSVSVVTRFPEGYRLYSGCCSLKPDP